MPLIHLTSFIEAPQERVFDLSLSVSLHKYSMSRFREQIVAGISSGTMKLGDEVTWTARHLFKDRKLKVKVTALRRPDFFCDEQLEGDFKVMKHEHYFKPVENGTIMIDQFYFESPYGLLGKLANSIFLENYLKTLLTERNAALRTVALGRQWNQFL